MSNQSNPFSAGESALGYLYQCRLALWFALLRLREREDTDVAIESLDDVTFSTDGKPTELLQTKHHLNAKANLADTSPDLWKTLRIWASQMSLLAQQDGGYILGKELRSQIDDLRDQFRQDNLPTDFGDIFPDEDVIKAMLGKPFVEQLRLIALADTRIRYAVADYYRAFEQRSRWLREDLLLVGDLENYERRLVEEWERAFERVKQSQEFHEERQMASAGRAVFDWAQEANIYIRPQCQQPYIHRGSFQIMSDRMTIGWHPDFLARLEHLLTPSGGNV